MEQRSDGIFLRPTGATVEKLSWDDTAREMEAACEDWSEWDFTSADGLADVPWNAGHIRRVAGPKPSYSASRKKKRS